MEVTQIVLSIIVIFAAARILGQLFHRMKLPVLVGEILAGMILGPSLFGIIHSDQSFSILTTVAIFFLMLVAGLEMNIRDIRKVGKSAIIISLIAFFVPFEVGSYAASLFGLDGVQSIFMGLLLSITALPVSAMVLMEFKILKSKIGNTVIAAAIINDIMAIAVLGVTVQISAAGGTLDTVNFGESMIKVGAFITVFLTSLIFGRKILPHKDSNRTYGLISVLTFGFFAPLFFGFIGVEFDANSIVNLLPLFVVLLAIAITSKIGGGFIGAKISKFSNDGSLAIGTLMNGRGMMELAIAAIGFSIGILDVNLFSNAVAIGFVTTILSPLLARPFINKLRKDKNTEVSEEVQETRQLETPQSQIS
jgi:Kef-type K+ transport system membrane component KefB